MVDFSFFGGRLQYPWLEDDTGGVKSGRKKGEEKEASVWHNVRCLGVRLSVYRLIYKLF